jgi:glyoxylase-like metal-dependent hydrolase (beta-lactamase superfamily II)
LSSIRVQQIQLAQFELPDFHPEAPGTDAVHGFVVRDADVCILVDTGIGTGSDLIDRLYKPRRSSLEQTLAKVNVSISEITGVVNTHLHFDHCGNNSLFPGVPIFVQEAELAAAQQRRYTVRNWVDFPGAHYVPVRGAHSLSENLEIVPTPGHTPGHQSLLVRSQGYTDIIVGQAAYTASEYQLFCQHRSPEQDEVLHRCVESNATWSREAYVASLEALARIHPYRAFFSHDQLVWTRAA